MTMVTTMEGAILKLPSLGMIKPNPKFTNLKSFSTRLQYRSRLCSVSTSASATETAASSSSSSPLFNDSKIGADSLGHITRPDFPILHQVCFFSFHPACSLFLMYLEFQFFTENTLFSLSISEFFLY